MERPFSYASAITPGTTFTVSRAIGVACTVAGNVELTLSSGNTIIIPVPVGWSELFYAATNVSSGGNTTATATYTRLE